MRFLPYLAFVVLLPALLAMSASARALEAEFDALPKIDAHAHMFADLPELAAALARLRFRVVNVCDGGNDPVMMKDKRGWVQSQFEKYPEVFSFCPTFDVTRRDEPGYGDEVRTYLDEAFGRGGVMIKIYKEVGLELKTPAGDWVMPDDGVFDPIYAHIAKSGSPLLAHFAEPLAAWLPLDPESVHYGYYSRHPEWHFYRRAEVPTHEAIIAARSHVLEKHPDLVMIGAHLGSLEHDVKVLGEYLDRHPNFHVDIAARSADLTRQPRDAVREFFLRYQDRVLYGSDIGIDLPESGVYSPAEAAQIIESVESHYRRDWCYFAGEGTVEIKGKTIECLALPEEVLEKLYYRNAERLMPGLRAR